MSESRARASNELKAGARDARDDLAGQSYWDETWSAEVLPPRLDPTRNGWRNHVEREFHRELTAAFGELRTPRRLLEIGCARSTFLPYLAHDFGFQVEGLDYSEVGAAQARRLLAREGVPGSVTCADMFAPPSTLLGRFDVVVSFGVMEHFRDTADALRAAARFLVPGGLLVTFVPNLAGVTGWLQKRMNPAVYAIHNPLDDRQLGAATTRAGLALVASRYVASSNFGVLNLVGVESAPGYGAKRRVYQLMCALSVAGWLVDERVVSVPRTRALSGYVLAVGRKPLT